MSKKKNREPYPPVTLEKLREPLVAGKVPTRHWLAETLIQFNGCPMTHVETVLLGLAELAGEEPLTREFFLRSLAERDERLNAFCIALMKCELP